MAMVPFYVDINLNLCEELSTRESSKRRTSILEYVYSIYVMVAVLVLTSNSIPSIDDICRTTVL